MRKIYKDQHYIFSELQKITFNGKESCTWGHLKSDLSQVGGSVYCEAARQIALKARGGAKRPKKVTGNQSAKQTKKNQLVLPYSPKVSSLMKHIKSI